MPLGLHRCARDAVGEALELAFACLCDPFIEPGDVATTEKGHKLLRQISRRGEFRSLRKRRSGPDPGSNTKHSDDAWELSRSDMVVLFLPRLHVHACQQPIARRSHDFQYNPVAEAPAKAAGPRGSRRPTALRAMPRTAREDVKVCEDANAPVRRQRPASAEQCACRRRAVGRSWMSGNPARAGGRFHPSVRVARPFGPPATVQGRAAARKCWSSLVARTP